MIVYVFEPFISISIPFAVFCHDRFSLLSLDRSMARPAAFSFFSINERIIPGLKRNIKALQLINKSRKLHRIMLFPSAGISRCTFSGQTGRLSTAKMEIVSLHTNDTTVPVGIDQ